MSPQNPGKREDGHGNPAQMELTPSCSPNVCSAHYSVGKGGSDPKFGELFLKEFFCHQDCTGCTPVTRKNSSGQGRPMQTSVTCHPAKLPHFRGFLEDLVVLFFFWLADVIFVTINDRI